MLDVHTQPDFKCVFVSLHSCAKKSSVRALSPQRTLRAEMEPRKARNE